MSKAFGVTLFDTKVYIMKFSLSFHQESSASRFVESLKERNVTNADVKKEDKTFEVSYSINFAEYEDKEKESEMATKDEVYDVARMVMSEMQYQMNFVFSEMRYLENALYEHTKGHLPPIKGAGKMKKALSALGLDDDYDVSKPVVRASKNGGKLEIDLSNA